jgi:hypothetical protein
MERDNSLLQSFEDILADYRAVHLHKADSEIEWYSKRPRSLSGATRRAALSRIPTGRGGRQIRHPHQRRISADVLEEVASRLESSVNKLQHITEFAKLYEVVRLEILPIRGVGELLVYDVSHRIGGYLKLEPLNVYLHAGTKRGAKALGLDTRRPYVQISELPKAFFQLTAAQAEDVLCIYAPSFARIRVIEQK